jgi:alkanesulfonate monooxygenase SsuD/methylene tetrahydromethanopterin reductase-like flavin-dependent oxidoreductase (luciferase family)
MWSDDDGPYTGTHYRLAETLNRPRPLSGSRLPVLIGGNGECKTLRLVARYADVCNFTVNEIDDVRREIDVLKRHCDREGRDFATIRVTVQGAIDPTQDPAGFLRRAGEYAALGVHHVQVRVRQPDPVGFVEQVAESVQARLAEIEPSRTR